MDCVKNLQLTPEIMYSEKMCKAGNVYIRTCRACLKPNDCDRNVQLNQDDWLETYNFCINPEITDKAMVQAMILCKNCSRLLRKFSKFKKKCLTSEVFWKALAKSELAVSIIKTEPNSVSVDTNFKRNTRTKEEKCEKEEIDTDNFDGDIITNNISHKIEKIKEEMTMVDDNWSIASDIDLKEENEQPKYNKKSFKGSCDKCGKKFKNRACLIKHVGICKKRKRQTYPRDQICKHNRDSDKCELCKILLTTNVDGTCGNCGKFYAKKYFLDRHVEFCVNKIEDVKFCGLCDHKPDDENWDERQHLLQHYENKDLKCQLCGYVGQDFARMISHRYLHHPSREITFDNTYYTRICVLCSKNAQSPRAAEFHFRKFHIGGKGGWCADCDKRFLTLKRWRHHHHDNADKTFGSECPECKKILTDIYQLRAHIKEYHIPSCFVCDSCGKTFKTQRTLTSHIENIHTDNDPVKCDHCGSTFKNKKRLHKHKRLISREKKVSCKFCPKTFQNQSMLASHIISHSEQRQELCKYCKKAFKTRSCMLAHIKCIHLGVKAYKCTICESSFRSSTLLAYHMSVHTGAKKFLCQFCDSSYHQHTLLNKHCLKKHKTDIMKE